MPKPGRVVLVALLAGIVFAAGLAPLCPAAGKERMGCCAPSSHCATGLKARAGCCKVDASPAAREAAALQRPQASSGWRLDALPAAAAVLSGVRPEPLPVLGSLSELSLAHHSVVPLYLLNSSILR